ncbi:ABC transporter permease [Micromonospora sp. WMMD882]|uniref:FtsX-like permease family protein n=1 Tax=Micromonospora sp. WMMD882 TaxID=3015151 RepID=UPI00248AA1DC|nr:ABC transporter permease [Micromonospora sp. WMMD882]WBB79763.1 ABC transporter permease [Micromonospora sp. WMMD882]
MSPRTTSAPARSRSAARPSAGRPVPGRRTTVLRTQLGDAVRRPARMAMIGLAMIIGAFVAFGTVLAQEITERTVVAGLSGTPEAVDLVVAPGDEESTTVAALTAARRTPGVAEAVGRVDLYCDIDGRLGLGFSLYADPGAGPLATVRVVTGSYPDAPGEIAVSERTADRLDLPPGSTVQVRGPGEGEVVRLTVSGVVSAPDDAGQVAYTRDSFVTRLAGHDSLGQIEARLAADADPDAVREALTRAVAGTGLAGVDPTVDTGEATRLAEAEAVTDQVRDVFALVAMFVAASLVAATLVATSTFRIVFAQRMRQLALLRAVGADRRALLRALVGEGAVTGLLAGAVGVLGAYAVGHLLPPALRGLGYAMAAPGHPVGAAVAVVLGTGLVAVLAVLAPAVTAARVAPLEALRTASVSAGQRGVARLRAAVGLLAVVGAALVAGLVVRGLPGPAEESYSPARPLLLIVVSGTLAYVALVALGPVLVRPALAVVGWPLRRLGPVSRLAVGGVGGAPRRAAAVSVVVALGVTLIAGTLIGAASIRTLVERELAGMAPADLQVVAVGEQSGTLPPGFVERVRADRELTGVVPYRSSADVGVPGTPVEGLVAVDLPLRQLSTWSDFGASAGSLTDLGPGRVALLSFYAREAGVTPGDDLTVSRGGRSVTLRVAATLDNTPADAGLLLDPADLDRLGVPSAPTGLLADLARDGERARTDAVQRLRAVGGPQVGVLVLADLRDEFEGDLDGLVGVVLALIGLTVVVAVTGVGTTTGLSVVERVRESALLRAVGLSRSRLRTMLTAEAALYGILGSGLGLLLALPYSWLAMAALGDGVPVTFPAGQLALVVVALAAATALAGLLPARRAARTDPAAALAADD